MSSTLHRSLDDIIMQSKRPGRRNGDSRGGARDSGSGPDRRFLNRNATRATPYMTRPPMLVQKPMLQETKMLREALDPEAGAKLYVSNLDYGVSDEDIEILFSEIGDLKRHSIHCDKSGRSKGTAEVVYRRPSDALAAIKRYNNVLLDGKPINIELIGTDFETPALVAPNSKSILGKPNSDFGSDRGKVAVSWVSDHIGHGYARGNTQRKNHHEKPNLTAEELDAELERYHLHAMQIDRS